MLCVQHHNHIMPGLEKVWAYLDHLMSSMVAPHVDHLLITNIKLTQSKVYYGLIFRQNQVIYTNRAPFQNQVYALDLKQKRITLNNQEMQAETLVVVIKHIRRVLWDLEDRQAKLYEKVKK